MTAFIWKKKISHSEKRADQTLVALLKEEDPTSPLYSYSRSQIQKLMEKGYVRLLNGKKVIPHDVLKKEDIVLIELPPQDSGDIHPEEKEIFILHEDQEILVINKQAGLTVHPSPTQRTGTLVHRLLHYTSSLSQQGGPLRPGIVHRLDKNTSGVLVIAKTNTAYQQLSTYFAHHHVKKKYLAFCYGAFSPEKGNKPIHCDTFIGRDPHQRTRMSMHVTQGKKAQSTIIQKEVFSSASASFASRMEVFIQTGRTHQIRVHLTGLGHSLLGDPEYGKPTKETHKWKILPKKVQLCVQELPGQALHAQEISFPHPQTGEWVTYTAPLSDALNRLLGALRNQD